MRDDRVIRKPSEEEHEIILESIKEQMQKQSQRENESASYKVDRNEIDIFNAKKIEQLNLLEFEMDIEEQLKKYSAEELFYFVYKKCLNKKEVIENNNNTNKNDFDLDSSDSVNLRDEDRDFIVLKILTHLIDDHQKQNDKDNTQLKIFSELFKKRLIEVYKLKTVALIKQKQKNNIMLFLLRNKHFELAYKVVNLLLKKHCLNPCLKADLRNITDNILTTLDDRKATTKKDRQYLRSILRKLLGHMKWNNDFMNFDYQLDPKIKPPKNKTEKYYRDVMIKYDIIDTDKVGQLKKDINSQLSANVVLTNQYESDKIEQVFRDAFIFLFDIEACNKYIKQLDEKLIQSYLLKYKTDQKDLEKKLSSVCVNKTKLNMTNLEYPVGDTLNKNNKQEEDHLSSYLTEYFNDYKIDVDVKGYKNEDSKSAILQGRYTTLVQMYIIIEAIKANKISVEGNQTMENCIPNEFINKLFADMREVNNKNKSLFEIIFNGNTHLFGENYVKSYTDKKILFTNIMKANDCKFLSYCLTTTFLQDLAKLEKMLEKDSFLSKESQHIARHSGESSVHNIFTLFNAVNFDKNNIVDTKLNEIEHNTAFSITDEEEKNKFYKKYSDKYK